MWTFGDSLMTRHCKDSFLICTLDGGTTDFEYIVKTNYIWSFSKEIFLKENPNLCSHYDHELDIGRQDILNVLPRMYSIKWNVLTFNESAIFNQKQNN